MKRFLLGSVLSFAASAACSPASGQQAGVPGVLTPQGTFRPLVTMQAASPAAAASYTGIYNATLNIAIASDAAHLDPSTLSCTLNIQVIDVNLGSSYYETGSVAAVVSGKTAVCQLAIPYNWKFNTGDAVQVQVSYSVAGTGGGALGRSTTANGVAIETAVTNGTKKYTFTPRI